MSQPHRPDTRPLAVALRWENRLYSDRSFTTSKDTLRPGVHDGEAAALFAAMTPPGHLLKEHMQKSRQTASTGSLLMRDARVPHVFTRVQRTPKSEGDAVAANSLLSGGSLHYAAPLHRAVPNPSGPRPRSATMRSARSFAVTPSTAGPGTYRNAYHLGLDHLRLRAAAFKRHVHDTQVCGEAARGGRRQDTPPRYIDSAQPAPWLLLLWRCPHLHPFPLTHHESSSPLSPRFVEPSRPPPNHLHRLLYSLLCAQRAIGEYDMTMPTGRFRRGADDASQVVTVKAAMDGGSTALSDATSAIRSLPMPQTPLAPYHSGVAFGQPEAAAPRPVRVEIASTSTGVWVAPGRYNAQAAEPLVRPRPRSAIVPRSSALEPSPSKLAPNSYHLPERPMDTTPAGASHVFRARPFARRPFAPPWKSAAQREGERKQGKARNEAAAHYVTHDGQQRKKEAAVERFRQRDARSADAAKRREAFDEARAAGGACTVSLPAGSATPHRPTRKM